MTARHPCADGRGVRRARRTAAAGPAAASSTALASLAVLALACAAMPAAAADRTDVTGAVAAARAFSYAQSTGDVERMSAWTHPAILRRQGGLAGTRAWYRDGLALQTRFGTRYVAETFGPARVVHDRGATTVVVPTIRTIDSWPAPYDVRHVYLVSDGGTGRGRRGAWKVVDIDCVHVGWVRVLAPGYRGVPDLSDLVAADPGRR